MPKSKQETNFDELAIFSRLGDEMIRQIYGYIHCFSGWDVPKVPRTMSISTGRRGISEYFSVMRELCTMRSVLVWDARRAFQYVWFKRHDLSLIFNKSNKNESNAINPTHAICDVIHSYARNANRDEEQYTHRCWRGSLPSPPSPTMMTTIRIQTRDLRARARIFIWFMVFVAHVR